jgi:hypothetical protein
MRSRLAIVGLCAAALFGCGGGGGDGGAGAGGQQLTAATDAADKYVGSWLLACEPIGGGQAEKELAEVKKTAADKLAVTLTLSTYNNTTCAGAAASAETNAGTVTIDGQSTATYSGAAQTLDKLSVAIAWGPGAGTYKWTGAVLSNQLLIDFEDNGVSSSTNYPSNPNEGQSLYAKQ